LLPGLAADLAATKPLADAAAQAKACATRGIWSVPQRNRPWPHRVFLHYQFHGRHVTVALSLNSLRPARHPEDATSPHRAQNFLEWLVETLYEFLEGLSAPSL